MDVTSDFEDFRDFTSDARYFRSDFKDYRNFREYRNFRGYRNFRPDFTDIWSDFRTHRISEVPSLPLLYACSKYLPILDESPVEDNPWGGEQSLGLEVGLAELVVLLTDE